jgi:hypothetical protein
MNKLKILLALFVLLILVRLSSPVDFFEGDQQKQVGYIMDILQNGNWSVQYEVNGEIATKPPLYNWLAALLAIITGTTAPWVMKLPSLIAGAGLLVLVFLIAEKLFNKDAAFWAVVALMASHHFIKLTWFARTDMLMVFSLHLAVYFLLFLTSSWYKALVIGLILGMSYLIKGPAGPSFFVIIFIIWAAREGSLFHPKRWIYIVPGIAVFCLIVGIYIAVVWRNPQFQEVAIKQELIARTPGMANHFDPVYNYFIWLFSRIAPWPIIAITGLFFARHRPERQSVNFVALWALGILGFMSALPDKRHDYLLALYPPIFILAGLGMHYLTGLYETRGYRWVTLSLAGILILVPVLMPFLMKQEVTAWIWLLSLVASCCGLLTVWYTQKKYRFALVWLCAGLIIMNGLYHYGLGNTHPIHLFEELRAFTTGVKSTVNEDQLRVWHSHPLISYELGIHQHVYNLKDLNTEPHPKWLITETKLADQVERATGWELQEQSSLVMKERYSRIDVRLYRVQKREAASVH